jgi:hypothetical protein
MGLASLLNKFDPAFGGLQDASLARGGFRFPKKNVFVVKAFLIMQYHFFPLAKRTDALHLTGTLATGEI